MIKKMFTVILIFLLIGSCKSIVGRNPKWYIDGRDSQAGLYDDDIVIHGDKLICVRSGRMLALNKHNGDILWISSGGGYQRTPVVVKDKVFNVSRGGEVLVTVLDLDGNVVHEVTHPEFTGNIVPSVPAFDEDKVYFAVVEDSYKQLIISVDIETYTVEIVCYTPGIHHARLILKDDILFVPYQNKHPSDRVAGLIAYDLVKKEEKWHTSFAPEDGIFGYNPIIHNDKMYICVSTNVREIDLETGEITRTFGEGQGHDGMSIGDNTLFLPDWLINFDLETGKERWDLVTEYSGGGGSVYYNGVFYVMYYGLMAIDEKTGQKLVYHDYGINAPEDDIWKYDLGYSMPAVDEDGTIYINATYGIYAFNPVK